MFHYYTYQTNNLQKTNCLGYLFRQPFLIPSCTAEEQGEGEEFLPSLEGFGESLVKTL